MVVAVKRKLHSTGPLVPDSQDHSCPVLLIERVARVNKDKTPIILLFMFTPEDAHCVDGDIYPRLQPSRKLRRAIYIPFTCGLKSKKLLVKSYFTCYEKVYNNRENI